MPVLTGGDGECGDGGCTVCTQGLAIPRDRESRRDGGPGGDGGDWMVDKRGARPGEREPDRQSNPGQAGSVAISGHGPCVAS